MKFMIKGALPTLLGASDEKGKCDRLYGDLNVPETEQGIALILEWWIASVEKPAKIDRKWILSTFVRCLAAVRSEQVVVEPYGL